MGYSLGSVNGRWIGYGVPATCDHPDCDTKIDRGMHYACGGSPRADPDTPGCGRFFCDKHVAYSHPTRDHDGFLCERCADDQEPFPPSPDHPEWIEHMLTDTSWQRWRDEHPAEVASMTAAHDGR